MITNQFYLFSKPASFLYNKVSLLIIFLFIRCFVNKSPGRGSLRFFGTFSALGALEAVKICTKSPLTLYPQCVFILLHWSLPSWHVCSSTPWRVRGQWWSRGHPRTWRWARRNSWAEGKPFSVKEPRKSVEKTSKIGNFLMKFQLFLLILSFVVKFVVSWRRWRLSGFGVNLVLFGNFIRTLFHVFRELSQRSFI